MQSWVPRTMVISVLTGFFSNFICTIWQAWEGRAYEYGLKNLSLLGYPVDGLKFDNHLVSACKNLKLHLILFDHILALPIDCKPNSWLSFPVSLENVRETL